MGAADTRDPRAQGREERATGPAKREGAGRLLPVVLHLSLPPLAAILFALAMNAWSRASIDTGWILDFGRSVVEQGAIPRVNSRTFLEPGHPLVMHEWLSCAGMYLLWRAGAGPALIFLRWVCVAGLVFLLDRAISRHSFVARSISLLAVASTLGPAVSLVRPQLASWLGLAVVVLLLFSPRSRLWWAFPLFAVWANLHAGYLAGIVVLSAGLAARRWDGEPLPATWIAGVPILSLLATFLTPYGPSLLLHNLEHALGAASHVTNHEWLSPLRATAHPWERRALAALALALALGAWKARGRRAWTLALLGTAAALSANRHFRMAPILLLPLVAEAIDALASSRPEKRARLAHVLDIGVVALSATMLAAGGKRLFRFVPYQGPDPGAAVEVLRRNGLSGPVWNDFNSGSLLLWAAPGVQVSCDGRNVAAYSGQALIDCVSFGTGSPWRRFESAGARFALLPWDHIAIPALRQHLAELYEGQGYVLLGPAEDRDEIRDLPELPVHECDYYQWHWEEDRPFAPTLLE